jgi:hypothetical protein
MSNLVHNEQVKLLATAFNNLGVGAALAGTVLPFINHPEASPFRGDNLEVFLGGYVMWVVFASVARWILGLLIE